MNIFRNTSSACLRSFNPFVQMRGTATGVIRHSDQNIKKFAKVVFPLGFLGVSGFLSYTNSRARCQPNTTNLKVSAERQTSPINQTPTTHPIQGIFTHGSISLNYVTTKFGTDVYNITSAELPSEEGRAVFEAMIKEVVTNKKKSHIEINTSSFALVDLALQAGFEIAFMNEDNRSIKLKYCAHGNKVCKFPSAATRELSVFARVINNKTGNSLLIENKFRKKFQEIGGKIEEASEPVLQGLLREVMEEVGLKPSVNDRIKLIAYREWPKDVNQLIPSVSLIFQIEGEFDETQKVNIESDEISSYKWMSEQEIINHAEVKDELKAMIAGAKNALVPFWDAKKGKYDYSCFVPESQWLQARRSVTTTAATPQQASGLPLHSIQQKWTLPLQRDFNRNFKANAQSIEEFVQAATHQLQTGEQYHRRGNEIVELELCWNSDHYDRLMANKNKINESLEYFLGIRKEVEQTQQTNVNKIFIKNGHFVESIIFVSDAAKKQFMGQNSVTIDGHTYYLTQQTGLLSPTDIMTIVQQNIEQLMKLSNPLDDLLDHVQNMRKKNSKAIGADWRDFHRE